MVVVVGWGGSSDGMVWARGTLSPERGVPAPAPFGVEFSLRSSPTPGGSPLSGPPLLPDPVVSAFVTEDSRLRRIPTQRCTRVEFQAGGNAKRRVAGVLGEAGAGDKDS